MPLPYLLYSLAFYRALEGAARDRELAERRQHFEEQVRQREMARELAKELLEAGATGEAAELFNVASRPITIPERQPQSFLERLLGPRPRVMYSMEPGRPAVPVSEDPRAPAGFIGPLTQLVGPEERRKRELAQFLAYEVERNKALTTARQRLEDRIYQKLAEGQDLTDAEQAFLLGFEAERRGIQKAQDLAYDIARRGALRTTREQFEEQLFQKLSEGRGLTEIEKAYVLGARPERPAGEGRPWGEERVDKALEAFHRAADQIRDRYARLLENIPIGHKDSRRQRDTILAAENQELSRLARSYQERFPEHRHLFTAPEPIVDPLVQDIHDELGQGPTPTPPPPGQQPGPPPPEPKGPVQPRMPLWETHVRPWLQEFQRRRQSVQFSIEADSVLVRAGIPLTANNRRRYVEARERGATPEQALDEVRRAMKEKPKSNADR